MSGEDQERFEDYLELKRYLEELQAGHAAHSPGKLTPAQARIYRMMMLFRSASPGETTPRPAFATALQTRLEQELQQAAKKHPRPFLARKPPGEPRTRARVSRRALLTGRATVAASLVVGAAIERAAEERSARSPGGPYPPLVPTNIPTTWHVATPLATLGNGPIYFVTDAIVDYVIRDDGDDGDPDRGKIIALSAACTHLGCIVPATAADGTHATINVLLLAMSMFAVLPSKKARQRTVVGKWVEKA